MSVYRTRAYILRRRALIGLAGVVLLLIGYGIGRWQDGSPAAALPAPASSPSTASARSAPASPSATAPSSAPPKPTVYPTLQAESAAVRLAYITSTKRLMRDASSVHLRRQLEDEIRSLADGTLGAEYREGLAAFAEKRTPNFANVKED